MKGLHKGVNTRRQDHWETLEKVLCHKDEAMKAKENKLLEKNKLFNGSYTGILAIKQLILYS